MRKFSDFKLADVHSPSDSQTPCMKIVNNKIKRPRHVLKSQILCTSHQKILVSQNAKTPKGPRPKSERGALRARTPGALTISALCNRAKI